MATKKQYTQEERNALRLKNERQRQAGYGNKLDKSNAQKNTPNTTGGYYPGKAYEKKKNSLSRRSTQSGVENGGSLKNSNGSKKTSNSDAIAKNQKKNEYKVSKQNNSVGYQNMMYRNTMAQMQKAKEKLYEDQLNPKKKKKG